MAKERWKLTSMQKQELVNLYLSGEYTPGQLAQKYDVGWSTVQYHLKKNVVQEQPKGKRGGSTYEVLIHKSIATMEQKLLDKSITPDRKAVIADTIKRYKDGLRNNKLYKKSATIYTVIGDIPMGD